MPHNDADRTYDDLFDREDPEDTEYGTTQRRDSGNWAYVTREDDTWEGERTGGEPQGHYALDPEREASDDPCENPPNPDEHFSFEVMNLYEDAQTFNFVPKYYPERFNVGRDRKIDGDSDSCKSELLSYKYLKNSRIHATGITLTDRENGLRAFQKLQNFRESKVLLLNNLLPDDGMDCFVESAEYGEWKGYDPVEGDFLVSWTLDLISLGDNGDTDQQGIISELNTDE